MFFSCLMVETSFDFIAWRVLIVWCDSLDDNEDAERETTENCTSGCVSVSVLNSSPPATRHDSSRVMKSVSLVSLTLQNVVSILLLRYVRTTPGPRFFNSTAVISSEVQKTILSILLVLNEERNVSNCFKSIYNKIVRQPFDTFKTGIPALLYTLQNNLLFVSISNLDAATFQVTPWFLFSFPFASKVSFAARWAINWRFSPRLSWWFSCYIVHWARLNGLPYFYFSSVFLSFKWKVWQQRHRSRTSMHSTDSSPS